MKTAWVGECLRAARKEAHLSQREASQRIIKPQQVLSKWELGKSQPHIGDVIELCKIYGLTLDQVFRIQHTKNKINLTKEEQRLIIAYRNAGKREQEIVKYLLRQLPEENSEK